MKAKTPIRKKFDRALTLLLALTVIGGSVHYVAGEMDYDAPYWEFQQNQESYDLTEGITYDESRFTDLRVEDDGGFDIAVLGKYTIKYSFLRVPAGDLPMEPEQPIAPEEPPAQPEPELPPETPTEPETPGTENGGETAAPGAGKDETTENPGGTENPDENKGEAPDSSENTGAENGSTENGSSDSAPAENGDANDADNAAEDNAPAADAAALALEASLNYNDELPETAGETTGEVYEKVPVETTEDAPVVISEEAVVYDGAVSDSGEDRIYFSRTVRVVEQPPLMVAADDPTAGSFTVQLGTPVWADEQKTTFSFTNAKIGAKNNNITTLTITLSNGELTDTIYNTRDEQNRQKEQPANSQMGIKRA